MKEAFESLDTEKCGLISSSDVSELVQIILLMHMSDVFTK